MIFFEIFICPIHPKSLNYSQKCHYFLLFLFFSKMSISLHHLSSSTSIYNIAIAMNTQPHWTTNLKLLMHLKIDFYSSYLISYALKQHLFHFLSIFIKKTQDFDSKFFKIHRAIQAHDSWSLTSGSLWWWSFVWLEKLNKLSY